MDTTKRCTCENGPCDGECSPPTGTPVYPGQPGYAAAVFAQALLALPKGATNTLEAGFAALDAAIAEALEVEREAAAERVALEPLFGEGTAGMRERFAMAARRHVDPAKK